MPSIGLGALAVLTGAVTVLLGAREHDHPTMGFGIVIELLGAILLALLVLP